LSWPWCLQPVTLQVADAVCFCDGVSLIKRAAPEDVRVLTAQFSRCITRQAMGVERKGKLFCKWVNTLFK
jgi:hypothetical protein